LSVAAAADDFPIACLEGLERLHTAPMGRGTPNQSATMHSRPAKR
jgi:hypothetical protein